MRIWRRFSYIIVSVLLVWFSIVIVKKYKRLSLPQSYNEVDSLSLMLSDVRTAYPTVSTISFNSNTDTGRKGVLYFKSALALAPIVVTLDESDTTLLLNDPALPALPREDYECLLSGGNKNLNYTLVRVKR